MEIAGRQPGESASIVEVASAAPGRACPRADPRRDPAAADPRWVDQRIRDGSLKPLPRRHGRVLASDRRPCTRCLAPATSAVMAAFARPRDLVVAFARALNAK